MSKAHVGSSWQVVAAAALATIMSAPGQTAAIAVFTEPLIADLGITRNALSTSYMIATLLGACAMPLIGRALDRYGVGPVMIVIGFVFGGVLMLLSLVTSLWGLTLGFIGMRMAGQGALGLAASTAVAVHVTRRRGLALGVTTAVGSAGIAMSPVLLEWMIRHLGTSTVWMIEGLAVWAVVLPLGWFFLHRQRNATRSAGETVREPEVRRGKTPEPSGTPVELGQAHQWTVREALHTPIFWIITAGVAASGMLGTGLNFHQIAALGERGLTATEAAANFIPQAIAMLIVTIGVGGLADRVRPKFAVMFSMMLLAGSLGLLNVVQDAWTAVGFGALLGASGGAVRTVEAAAFTRYFGTVHIGAIRGIVTTISVGSTAFGPVVLSLGYGVFGSYGVAAAVLATVPVAVGFAALFAGEPQRHTEQ
ncbi:MFS transporter [Nesterenkonia sp. AY15]|uniref:MFS transporter n=1 Tax=Nesterenkonia sp. AY15 TaxID=2901139 RepID=UPI001F4CCC3C|nr:MFS transporter [Nesterenkonia sp. AY15]MCH8572218.1 MFS transporter [Nesterenkonia sp. AY15]